MKLHERLGIQLEDINRMLCEVVTSDPDIPRPSVMYDQIIQLIQSGGKRLRPMMVIVGSRFGKSDDPTLPLRTAGMLEYLHMASLVHDDIIDQADTRRGMPTIHTATDVQTAVYIGNYMIARAMEWAVNVDIDEREAHAYRLTELAAMVTDLCVGEYEQLEHRFNYDITLAQYLEKTRRKTALLMANCLKAGAEAANADSRTSKALYHFGEALGMAFQIQDDLLDFTQPAEAIGKPAGADLRNGQITLPVIYALQDPKLAPRIRKLGPDSPESEFDQVISRIQQHPAIEQTREYARSYITLAEQLMTKFKHHPAYDDLQSLAEYFMSKFKAA